MMTKSLMHKNYNYICIYAIQQIFALAPKYNNVQQGLWKRRHFFYKRAVAEHLKHIPQMSKDKAEYGFKSHHKIAGNKGIGGADKQRYARDNPECKLRFGNAFGWVFLYFICHRSHIAFLCCK